MAHADMKDKIYTVGGRFPESGRTNTNEGRASWYDVTKAEWLKGDDYDLNKH